MSNKHGLFFGGFYPKLGNVAFGLSNTQATGNPYQGDILEEQASMIYHRGTGNHKLATYFRKKNWDCEVLDYMTEFDWDEIIDYIDTRITKDTVFCGWSVVFSMTDGVPQYVNKVIQYIRDKHPHVIHIAGGWYGRSLRDIDCDYWVLGNAEFAMEAILNKHTGYSDEIEHIHKVTNVNGKEGYLIDAVHTHKCYPKRDANISYEERDYIQPYEYLVLELSRGCRFACKFCMYPLIGMKEDTTREETSLHTEMMENYERWGIQNYYLSDDTVNDRPEKMEMIAKVARKLPFQPFLGGYARFDMLVTHGKETWDHMIEAGFTAHHYGLETFNHKAGKIIGKGMHPDKVKDKLLEVQEYFMEKAPTAYCGSSTFITGLEEESMDSLDDTADWLNKNWIHQRVGMGTLDINPAKNNDFEKFDLSNMGGTLASGREVERYGKSEYYFYTKEEIKHMFLDKGTQFWFSMNRRFRNRDYLNDGTLWRHPSDEYDMIDVIEWGGEFLRQRADLGAQTETCFRIHVPLATDYGKNRDTEIRKYFHNNPKKKDHKPIIKHIAKYKKMKLEQDWRKGRE
jgi:hypothetical protein